MKENHLIVKAIKYSLYPFTKNDSENLTYVYFPEFGSDGKFYEQNVKRGEQYERVLPGNGTVFLGAATKFLLSISANKVCRLQGKGCFTTGSVPIAIHADNFLIEQPSHSKVNVSNYYDETYLVISAIKGKIEVKRYLDSIIIEPGQELRMHRGTGDYEIRKMKSDASQWTEEIYKGDGADLNHLFRELGRLYDKNVILSGIENFKPHLLSSVPYKGKTLLNILEVYRYIFPELSITLNGDNLSVSRREKL
jgi:hypothetical protein